jgi:membrane fusion protein, multidrug efflux system
MHANHQRRAALCFAWITFLAVSSQAQERSFREGVAKPFRVVTMSASLREVITSINVEEGDRIQAGQVLVSLEAEKEKLAAERTVQLIAKAQFDYNAAKRLFEQNISSRDDMLSKEVDLKRLETELKIANAEVAEREMVAPLTGVVVHRYHEPGEAVNEAEPILQVMDADKLLLLFYLEAPMLSLLKMGDEIDVVFPEMTPEVERKAKIHFIDPEVDARSGMFRVRLLMDNTDQAVRPGMKVRGAFPELKPAR